MSFFLEITHYCVGHKVRLGFSVTSYKNPNELFWPTQYLQAKGIIYVTCFQRFQEEKKKYIYIYIYISFSYIHIARGYDEVKHSQELTAKESEGRAQRNSSYYACDFFANLRLFPSYKLEKRASQPDTPTRVQISALPLKSILAHIT